MSYLSIADACVCCGATDLERSPAVLMPFVAARAMGWEPAVINESWGLQTIPNGNAYAICNSLMCRRCGHLFIDLRFGDRELQRLYHGYRGADYTQQREYYEPGYTQRNTKLRAGVNYRLETEDFIRPFVRTNLRVLDWGGDTGANTPFLNTCVTHHVIDVSEVLPIATAEHVSKSKAQTEDYDLVVCSNVLEHVPYPIDLMNDLAKCMRRDTVLYIEVPFEELMKKDPNQRLAAKRHWHEHINFFSLHSIQELVDRAGLMTHSMRTHDVSIADQPRTVLQMVCAR